MKNICDWNNCFEIGEYKAPIEKDNSKNFKWLCNEHIKLFNMLPLRTSLIPKHITLDSEILIQNFKDKIKNNINEFPKEIINIENLRRKFVKYQNTLWNLMFKTNIKKINSSME